MTGRGGILLPLDGMGRSIDFSTTGRDDMYFFTMGRDGTYMLFFDGTGQHIFFSGGDGTRMFVHLDMTCFT